MISYNNMKIISYFFKTSLINKCLNMILMLQYLLQKIYLFFTIFHDLFYLSFQIETQVSIASTKSDLSKPTKTDSISSDMQDVVGKKLSQDSPQSILDKADSFADLQQSTEKDFSFISQTESKVIRIVITFNLNLVIGKQYLSIYLWIYLVNYSCFVKLADRLPACNSRQFSITD